MAKATRHEQLAAKYPTKYSRDGCKITLGCLVESFSDLVDSLNVDNPLDRDKISDWLDQEFLFGCWGHVLREIHEHDFSRDVKGFIFAVYKEGLRRGRLGAGHAE